MGGPFHSHGIGLLPVYVRYLANHSIAGKEDPRLLANSPFPAVSVPGPPCCATDDKCLRTITTLIRGGTKALGTSSKHLLDPHQSALHPGNMGNLLSSPVSLSTGGDHLT